MERREKVTTAEEAAALIKDGDTVAIGGFVLQNKPMALIRSLLRRRVKDLFLVAPGPAGMDADMLIGAGCVRKLACPGVHLEMMGPVGHRFRTFAQTERLEVWEASHNIMHTALRASAQGLAFLPTKAGLGSDILKVNPDLKLFRDPLKGQLLVAVPAITPNVGIVQTLRSDPYGNAQHGGGIAFFDPLIVRAAEQVIVVTEKVVSPDVIKTDPSRTTVGCENVVAVVEAPYGAHPCSSWASYRYDEDVVREYATAARSDEAFAAFLDKYAYGPKDHNAYLELIGVRKLFSLSQDRREPKTTAEAGGAAAVSEQVAADSKFSISELMACILSQEIKDGELVQSGGVRTGVVVAAHALARLTHAPNATFVSSLAFNTTAPLTRFSTDFEKFAAAERIPFDASESADRFHQGRYDWSALGGLQVDKYGNVNLTCIGDWKRPRLRGPGAAGIPSNIWAKRTYIWMTEHSTRTFVDKVDFITAPGYIDGPTGREKAGITWGGPVLVLSPLGVMDFHPESKRMRLKSVHPGVSVQQVVENTGFELIVPAKVPETPSPTKEELTILRTKVDPHGILRQVLPYG